MNLLKFLLSSCRGMVTLTIVTALVSGACNAGLIALINHVVNETQEATWLLYTAFIALLIGKLATNYFSQVWLIAFGQKSIAALRRKLARSILDIPLRRVEEIGAGRLLAALSDDVNHLTMALYSFPALSVNLAILLGGAVYLGWLSVAMFWTLIIFIVFGAISYKIIIARAHHVLTFAREAEDRLFGHFRALTDGIKELKLHRGRRGAYLKDLEEITDTFRRHNVRAESRFILAHSWAHLLFFMLIGLMLFALPIIETPNRKTLTGYVLTALYLMGPLAGMMANLPILTRAAVSLRKIDDLGLSLANAVEPSAAGGTGAAKSFSRLQLRGVTHTYRSEKDDSHFVLGPINLQFRPAEVVFLVGGNGSGKSTLAKIITGLYAPEAGDITLDDTPVTDESRDEFRQLFSAVFGDFYLFDRLLGLVGDDLDARALHYLRELHLDHKVKITGAELSTTSLSQGQRKRLALLTAYLEDRDFYLFDEWASDQDPAFKETFYCQLLPELRARGKAVLVITHDDKYFHLADRLIKLADGKIAYEAAVDAADAGTMDTERRKQAATVVA